MIQILKKMSNIESEHLRVLVYVILAQIINENEFDKLNDPSSKINNLNISEFELFIINLI